MPKSDPTELPLVELKLRIGSTGPIIVEDVVEAVVGSLGERLSERETILLREIGGLGRIIDQTKADLAEFGVESIRNSHIPTATGELDAITQHTAMATNVILECCETLERLGATLDRESAGIVQDTVTQIYEACSFQDITGQRITKVVRALKDIEAKVLELSGGLAAAVGYAAAASIIDPLDESTLLNGPSMPDEAMKQDDIDKLLNDF